MRKFMSFAAVAAAATVATLIQAGPASALGGEDLQCRVSPGSTFTFSDFCTNDTPSSSGYVIAFQVQNTSGSYSYSWSLPAYSSVYTGCGSSDSYCSISVGRAGREYDMSVTLSQGGSSEELDSGATIDAWCSLNPPEKC